MWMGYIDDFLGLVGFPELFGSFSELCPFSILPVSF